METDTEENAMSFAVGLLAADMGKTGHFKTVPQAQYIKKINFSLDPFLQLYFKI